MATVLGAVAAYLAGALPIHRLVRLAPARPAAALEIALDVFRGALAVSWMPDGPGLLGLSVAATAVLAGRQWPLGAPLGETGLAVAAGALTMVTPLAAPCWAFSGALAYVASGYPAVGRAAGAALLPLTAGFIGGWAFGLATVPCCLLLLERERDALRRVLLGTAPKHVWRSEP
jgi:glycerol-3-phosphate acyltransferase PlsY